MGNADISNDVLFELGFNRWRYHHKDYLYHVPFHAPRTKTAFLMCKPRTKKIPQLIGQKCNILYMYVVVTAQLREVRVRRKRSSSSHNLGRNKNETQKTIAPIFYGKWHTREEGRVQQCVHRLGGSQHQGWNLDYKVYIREYHLRDTCPRLSYILCFVFVLPTTYHVTGDIKLMHKISIPF